MITRASGKGLADCSPVATLGRLCYQPPLRDAMGVVAIKVGPGYSGCDAAKVPALLRTS